MKDVLDPLTRIPGVRLALLISEDGVPIASAKGDPGRSAEEADRAETAEELEAFCGLAAGWYGELHRAVDPLAWNRPKRISMRCARGTLVMQDCERVILTVLLHRGVVIDELRLPLGSAIARLERNRRRGQTEQRGRETEHTNDGPPGLFPGVSRNHTESGTDVRTQNEVPETSGER
ncbi:MAG: roadblock/LC7 domain-containing protein [Planctomycetes bacterium]|nr:roadblock/LC7 domain-containing protein [Planctomycetota bacterium]MCB9903725.1 roadblock/LC7 domain-containing protein [Planctomycetota bacterium]